MKVQAIQAILSLLMAFFAGITTKGYTVPYTWEVPAQIDSMTLRLDCQATYPGYWYWNYGVRSIDVLDAQENVLQTLSVSEEEGWEVTNCWERNGDIFLEDLNFDGIPDIRLMLTSGVVNISYMCWLWNPELEQYEYKFILNGYDVIVDNDTQEIITMSRDGWGQYYIDYFKYNNEEELYHYKQVHEDMVEETTTTTIYD